MATHRYDPYLWVHLAGLATVPLWLAICGLGLAVGSPQWPGLELALLSLVGVSPVLWMQVAKPFYIFSLLALTLKPTALSDDQRRMLTLFQRWWVRGLAVAAPVPLVWLLWEIYPRAVVASDITPFAPWGRLGGLAVAAGSFAMANLFLQVPVSVLAVMATSDKRFKRTTPYPLDKINDTFTQVGIPLNRLLPEVLPPETAVSNLQDSSEAEDIAIQGERPEDPAIQAVVAQEPIVQESLVQESLEPESLEPESLESEAIVQEPIVQESLEQAVVEQAVVIQDAGQPSEALADSTRLDHEATPEVDDLGPNLPAPESPELERPAVDALAPEALAPDLPDLDTATPAESSAGDDLGPDAPLDRETSTDPSEAEVSASDGSEVSDLGAGLEPGLEPAVRVDEVQVEAATLPSSVTESTPEDAPSPDTEVPETEDWDQGEDAWNQANHGWDQDPAWDTSVDSTKERTVEVAVVRISDPP